MKKTILNILLAVTAAGFLFCLVMIGRYYYQGWLYKSDIKDLIDKISGGIVTPYAPAPTEPLPTPNPEEPVTTPSVTEVPKSRFSLEISDGWKEQLATLQSENADCVGFLQIPDTQVAFPVMFTEKDPEYYLHRNFKKKKDDRGTPFLDGATVLGESANYIIYGHNMRDGSVFGTLKKYLDDDSFVEAHKYIYFNTPFSEGVYEVFAVCWVMVDTSPDVFRYDAYGGAITKNQFDLYVSQVRAASHYQSDVTVEWWDQLLTLSTCLHDRSYNDNGRLIVVAKRVQ